MESRTTARVVVLIPPPVPPGDAPTNMSSVSRNWVDSERVVRSTVLKPAVLEETLRKKVPRSLSFHPRDQMPV